MNPTPGNDLPDDPHLAEDIGAAPESAEEQIRDENLPTGMTNAGQQVSGVREAGTPEHELTEEDGTPAEGGYRPPASD